MSEWKGWFCWGFAEAFNLSIYHELLIAKLGAYEFDDNALEIFIVILVIDGNALK